MAAWPPHRAMNGSLANRCRWYRSVPRVQGSSRDWWRTGTRPLWPSGAASSSSCTSGSGGGAASSGSCATGSGWSCCDAATNSGLAWLGGGTWRSAVAGGRSGDIIGNEVAPSVRGTDGVISLSTIPPSSRWTLAARTNGPNYDQQKNGTSGDLQISMDACMSYER